MSIGDDYAKDGLKIFSGWFEKWVKDIRWKQVFFEEGWSFRKKNQPESEQTVISLFSDSEMLKIAKESKKVEAFELKDFLFKEFYKRFITFEEERDASDDANMLLDRVVACIEELGDSDLNFKIWLSEWKKEYKNDLGNIHQYLEAIRNQPDTLLDADAVNRRLHRNSKRHGMSLNYFETDDDSFLNELKNQIDREVIYVSGQNGEETAYCVMYALHHMNLPADRKIFLVESINSWKHLYELKEKGNILIALVPEEVYAIPDQTNIFILPDHLNIHREAINLKRRKQTTLIRCLQNSGYSDSEAMDLIKKTHGYYSSLKSELFNYVLQSVPEWVSQCSDHIITALLCGEWEECDRDKELIEKLSKDSYHNFWMELKRYIHTEKPFVVEMHLFAGNGYGVVNPETAWNMLHNRIDPDVMDRFLEMVKEAIGTVDQYFYEPLNQHNFYSAETRDREYSLILRKSILDSLTFCIHEFGHNEFQPAAGRVIYDLLHECKETEQYFSISRFLCEICECSPEVFLDWIEKRLETDEKLKKIITGDKLIDFFDSRHKYGRDFIEAISLLLYVRGLASRALSVLMQIGLSDTLHHSYAEEMVQSFFSCYDSESVFSSHEIGKLADMYIREYTGMWRILWDIIANQSLLIPSVPRFKIRKTEEVICSENDIRQLKSYYFDLCLEHADSSDRWLKIIEDISKENMNNTMLVKLLKALEVYTEKASDPDKLILKNELRKLVFNNRYFKDAEWAFGEDIIRQFEFLIENIRFDQPELEYAYLFVPKDDFPISDPVPYEGNADGQRVNDEKIIDILKKEFALMKEAQIPLKDVLKHAPLTEQGRWIGRNLAKYYDEEFNEEIFALLIDEFPDNKQPALSYYESFQRIDSSVIDSALKIAEEKQQSVMFMAAIMKSESWLKKESSKIAHCEETIKKSYWCSIYDPVVPDDRSACLWALSECRQFGNVSSYISILYWSLKCLRPDDVLQSFLSITWENENHMMEFNLLNEAAGIIRYLADYYIDNAEIRKLISDQEVRFLVLPAENMPFTVRRIQEDPEFYTRLIGVVYNKDDSDQPPIKVDDEEIRSSLFKLLYKLTFVPCLENDGINERRLLEWIQKFTDLTDRQGQHKLGERWLGKVLANVLYDPDEIIRESETIYRVIEERKSDLLEIELELQLFNNQSAFISVSQNNRIKKLETKQSNQKLSEIYKKKANKAAVLYPRTAAVLNRLSKYYHGDAERLRRIQEDEF